VWMQLVHLLITDILWIMLVVLSASLLANQPQARAIVQEPKASITP